MAKEFEIKGLEKAIRKFNKLPGERKKGMEDLIKASSRKIKSGQVSRVPVDTGATKRSIKIKTDKSKMGAKVGPQGKGAWKAHFIENGTGGDTPTAAQPFIFPPWEEERPKFIAEAAKEMRKTK